MMLLLPERNVPNKAEMSERMKEWNFREKQCFETGQTTHLSVGTKGKVQTTRNMKGSTIKLKFLRKNIFGLAAMIETSPIEVHRNVPNSSITQKRRVNSDIHITKRNLNLVMWIKLA